MIDKKIVSQLDYINHKICCLKKEINKGASFITVNTYNDLPLAEEHNDEFYFVLNDQGTWWVPGTIVGTYYSKGFYYSNGIQWIFAGNIPYQASQSDVNAGLINNQFVTPLTLKNSTQWDTKANISHTHIISDVTGLQTALDSKLSSVPLEYVTELELMAELSNYVEDTDVRLTDARTPLAHTHPQSDIIGLTSDLANKQDTLVSATNIKTVNGNSILGSGDLVISGGSTSLGLWDYWNQVSFNSNIATPGGLFSGTSLSSGTIIGTNVSTNPTYYQSYNHFGTIVRSSGTGLSGYTFRINTSANFRPNNDSIVVTCSFKLPAITDRLFRFGISPAIGNTILNDITGCVLDYNSNNGVVRLNSRNSILATFVPVAGSNYTCKIIYSPILTTFVVWENTNTTPIVNVTGSTGVGGGTACLIGVQANRHTTTGVTDLAVIYSMGFGTLGGYNKYIGL